MARTQLVACSDEGPEWWQEGPNRGEELFAAPKSPRTAPSAVTSIKADSDDGAIAALLEQVGCTMPITTKER